MAEPTGATVWTTIDGGWTWRRGDLAAPTPAGSVAVKSMALDSTGRLALVASVDDPPHARTPGAATAVSYESGDGGTTWTKRSDVRGPSQSIGFDWLHAFNSTHWLAGIDYAQTQGGEQPWGETFDGGLTWSISNRPNLSLAWHLSWWSDADGVMLSGDALCGSNCGSPPVIYFTHDGGADWSRANQ